MGHFNFLNIFRHPAPVPEPPEYRGLPEQEAPAYRPRVGMGANVVSLTGGGVSPSMAVSTVCRCIQLISESIASLPLRVMQRRGAIYLPEVNSPLSWALEFEPNAETSAFDFWRKAAQDILVWGNAYIIPTWGEGRVTLRLCTATAVAYDPYADTYNITDELQGIYGLYPSYKVVHLRGLTLDGKTGVSVLTFARKSIDIAARGAVEQEKRIARGGTVRGIISNASPTPHWAGNTPDQLADIADHMNERLEAGNNIVAQPGEGRFTQLTMSSVDMQFLESREFEVRELCRFFGVHPSFVFDDTSNNYKSAETANSAFLTNTLNPFLRKIEIELTRKLFPMKARRGECRIMFDRTALFAMDLDSRARHQKSRLEMGTATVNELRIEDNMPPVDGGETPLVTANLRAISELTAQNTSATTNDNHTNN